MTLLDIEELALDGYLDEAKRRFVEAGFLPKVDNLSKAQFLALLVRIQNDDLLRY